MFFPPREIVDRVKKEFPSGTRVELVELNDPYRHFDAGLKGTVSCVDDTGTIHVDWDNGNCLGIVYGEDSCRKLDTVTVTCYGKTEKWDSRKEAGEFYLKAIAGSEGSECERYTKIYKEIMMGLPVCTDGEA
jgi:hypothetical protein